MTRQASCEVATVGELLAAVADANVRRIRVRSLIADVPSLRLGPGQAMAGDGGAAGLRFAPGQDGLQLSADNHVGGLGLFADRARRVLFNDTSLDSLGRLELKGLRVRGVVELLAADRVQSGHVEAHDVFVEAADAREYGPRPQGYGVQVIPGAFTLWNRQPDASVIITADLTGLAAGLPGAPVRGSGIFLSGAGEAGGRLVVRRLETGAVHSDGGIAPGTPDRIAGAVFTVHGAVVDAVRIGGPVATYGANDMVLDNWGTVDRWVVEGKVTSFGPSAIGFVNFGTINHLEANAATETFGGGARGFNVYAGTVAQAIFDRIVTHGDGAVGIQISRPVGKLKVRRGIETHGAAGPSLVKGVVVELAAVALSLKPGGSVHVAEIAGGLITHGKAVAPIELHGRIGQLSVAGGMAAACDSQDGS